MIDYGKFQKALNHLKAQYDNYKSLDEGQPRLMREAVAESVIHRFETCYDCLWKALKRYLLEELGIPEVPNSPKPIFRMANENSLLDAHVEKWLEYAQARVNTSHDYSGDKATGALDLMDDFIDDAIAIYQTMSGRTWG